LNTVFSVLLDGDGVVVIGHTVKSESKKRERDREREREREIERERDREREGSYC